MGVDDFNDPLNFDEINAAPADLPPLPPQPRDPPKRAADDGKRFIPSQLISANFAWQTRDIFVAGERDLFGPVNAKRWVTRGVFAESPTNVQIEEELAASNEARAELSLDLVDEGLFVRFRPPGNSANVVSQFVEAMGIEQFYVEDVREI